MPRKRAADIANLPLPALIPTKKSRADRHVDFVDVQAAKSRERQRSEWRPDEDRAVLYLFIGSVIFIPRYNLDKVFIYNAIQIRDIMHRRVPISKTKTCAVIRRRLHGMFKSRTLYSRYKAMLDKALRDEELYTKLIEPHLPPPSISMFHKVPDSALEAVLDYLNNKFSPNNNKRQVEGIGNEQPENVIIDLESETETTNIEIHAPADLETLLDGRELRRMETIWTDIWANVFFCFYRHKKTLAPIVPMNSEEVQQLHTEGFVIEDHGPSWILPYARVDVPSAPPNPEDISFYSDDQLEFAFDVATTLVSTADKVITEEPPSSSSDDDEDDEIIDDRLRPTQKMKIITLKQKGEGGHVPDLCTGERNAASSTEVDTWTYRTAFMSVLMGGAGGGATENIRTFLSFIPDTALSRLANSLRSRGIFTMLKKNRRLILTNNMKRKLTNYLHPNAFRVAHSLLTSLQKNSGACVSLTSLQNIGAAYILTEIASLVHINIYNPSRIITVKEEWHDDYQSILASQHLVAEDRREEFALRLLRFRLNADNVKAKLVEKDFFDINLPQIELTPKLDEDQFIPESSLKTLIFGSSDEFSNEKLVLQHKLLQTVDLSFEEMVKPKPVFPIEQEKYSGLYDLIDITGDIGISIAFLLKHFTRNEVREGLDFLLENKYVYLVGIRNRKFVTSRHMYKWSVLIPANEESPEKWVVVRPWIDSLGEINWKLVDRVIVGLLGQIHRHSQLFVHYLVQSLSPLFSPVEVFIFICMLREMNIVDLFKFRDIKPRQKFNLFSKWNELDGEEGTDLEFPIKDYSIDTVLDLEHSWVELMPFAVSKYSRIQSIILPQEGVVYEDDDEYNRFDPEDVEIMVGQHEQEQDKIEQEQIEIEIEQEEEQDEYEEEILP